jgi:hypothetical protein
MAIQYSDKTFNMDEIVGSPYEVEEGVTVEIAEGVTVEIDLPDGAVITEAPIRVMF